MFRVVFVAILLVTLMVNIIFLFATKEKPPDLAASTTLVSLAADFSAGSSWRPAREQRRLFLRSNDFYDYAPVAPNESGRPNGSRLERVHLEPLEQVLSEAPASGDRLAPVSMGGAPSGFGAAELAKRKGYAAEWATTTTFAYDNHEHSRRADERDTSASSGATRSPTETERPADGDNEIRPFVSGFHLGAIRGPKAAAKQHGPQRRAPDAADQKHDQAEGAGRARNKPVVRLRVKSSKNHVLISLDDSIIYQSGGGGGQEPSGAPGTRSSAFNKRRATRRMSRNKNANQQNAPPDRDSSSSADAEADAAADAEPEPEPAPEPEPEADSEASRGIHVLVLNQFDGSIMSKRLFDTYSPQQDDQLALYIGQIGEGRILVFAVKDEASFKMARNSAARRLLHALGSRHIFDLGWRDMWAMVAVKRRAELLETNALIGQSRPGGPTKRAHAHSLAEAFSRSADFAHWGRPVEAEAALELEEAPELAPESCLESERRRRFCSRLEGYGRVCDCRFPSRIEFAPEPIEGSRLAQVPVLVMASNRPYYLYRMLKSLLQARGLNSSMVAVFIDGFYEEPAELCKLFNLRYVQHKPTGSRSARISNHYKTSLSLAFQQLFPQASHAIIFEEDLDVAPDALVYFHQTLPILARDPSLYCVSAWNDQGYEHSVGNLSLVYRVETMPGLGWMLSRELFVGELQRAWPAPSQQHDWDMWIRTGPMRRGRECLIPDVSRTFHFGSTGTNINSLFQRQYFSGHAFSANHLDSAAAARLLFSDLDELVGEQYDSLLERIVSEQSRPIRWRPLGQPAALNASSRAQLERQFLCSLANMTHYLGAREVVEHANRTGDGFASGWNLDAAAADAAANSDYQDESNSRRRTNVIFINMIAEDDFVNWLQLAKCWRLWDLDARGHHKASWRLFLNGRATLVVGHPVSPLSRLKPHDLVPFDMRAIAAA